MRTAVARVSREVPCGRFALRTGARTLVMGVLNVTPDSFSDGGAFADLGRAVERGREIVEEGADLVDVGGESTRPGAAAMTEEVEIERVVPVVRRLAAELSVPVSVDTSKASVAEAALAEGASVVNDVTALADPRMAEVVARASAGLALMHMKGSPRTMQQAPEYGDLIGEISSFLAERVRRAVDAGVVECRLMVDPGIGFGKTAEMSLQILARLGDFATLGRPVLVGPSRKSFIGKTLDLAVGERMEGTIAACAIAAWNGADMVRVHDVRACVRAVRLVDAMRAQCDVE